MFVNLINLTSVHTEFRARLFDLL